MALGTVLWFNKDKGYGFIGPDEGEKDVFVHVSALDKASIKELCEGDRLEYEVYQSGTGGRVAAGNLKILE